MPSVMLSHRWFDLRYFKFFHTDFFKQTLYFEHLSLTTDAHGEIRTPVVTLLSLPNQELFLHMTMNSGVKKVLFSLPWQLITE